MQPILTGTMLLLLVLALTQILIWAGQAYIRRRDNNLAREFLEVQLLAEGEALRAATRNREASQAVLCG